MANEAVATPHSVEAFVQGYETSGVLLGYRCPRCGRRTATWGLACSACGQAPLEETSLGTEGRVVAATVVSVPSEEFVNDAPYAYVVVELDGGGRVSGWMPSVRTPQQVLLGTRVRFVRSYKPGVQFEPADSPRGGGRSA